MKIDVSSGCAEENPLKKGKGRSLRSPLQDLPCLRILDTLDKQFNYMSNKNICQTKEMGNLRTHYMSNLRTH